MTPTKIGKKILVYIIELVLIAAFAFTSYAWFDAQTTISGVTPVQAGTVGATYSVKIDSTYYGEPDIYNNSDVSKPPNAKDADGDAIPVTVTITNSGNVPIVFELDFSGIIGVAGAEIKDSSGRPLGTVDSLTLTSLGLTKSAAGNKIYGVIQPTAGGSPTDVKFNLNVTLYAMTYGANSNNITQNETFTIGTSGMTLRYCQATKTAVINVFPDAPPAFTSLLSD